MPQLTHRNEMKYSERDLIHGEEKLEKLSHPLKFPR